MKIGKDTAVTVRYKVTDAQGKVLDKGDGAQAYLHGGYGGTFPKIEQALEGQEVGHAVDIELLPEDAFGVHDENLVLTIPKTQFPPGVKVGGQLQGTDDRGQTQSFTVVKIKGDQVLLDGNHPLAGKTLRFSVKVLAVRAASAEEIAHGHVHGEHGHHH